MGKKDFYDRPPLEIYMRADEMGSVPFEYKKSYIESSAKQYRMKTLFYSLFCVYFVPFAHSHVLTLSVCLSVCNKY